jgi:hypothetical protein
MTPIDTPRPIAAGTGSPDSGSDVVDGSAVDEDEMRLVCKLDDGSEEADVTDGTGECSASFVLVAIVVVVSCVYIGDGTGIVFGASEDDGTACTSDGCVVRSGGSSPPFMVLVSISRVVTTVVAMGSIDMTIGVSPPVLVDADMVTKSTCYYAMLWVREGDGWDEVAMTWCRGAEG